MAQQAPENGGSSGNSGMAKLLSQLNLPTLVAVLVMSGGNLWETRSGNDFNAKELERAIEEIHQLYPRLNEAIERQKRMQDSLDQLARQTHP